MRHACGARRSLKGARRTVGVWSATAVSAIAIALGGCGAGPTPGASPDAGRQSSAVAPSAPPAVEVTVAPAVPGVGMRVVGVQRMAPNVVELRVEIRNLAETPVDLRVLGDQGPWLGESFVATPDGQRRFFVLQAPDGSRVATEPPATVAPGQTVMGTVRYGAVPDEAGVLDFHAAHIEPARGLVVQSLARPEP